MSVFHIPSCYLSLVVIVNTKRGEIYFFKFIRIGGQSIRKKKHGGTNRKKMVPGRIFPPKECKLY